MWPGAWEEGNQITTDELAEDPVYDRTALRRALKRSASALKRDGVPFALAGGYALWAHGAPESENDVDFVVAEEDTERAADGLSDAGVGGVRPPGGRGPARGRTGCSRRPRTASSSTSCTASWGSGSTRTCSTGPRRWTC